MVTQNKKPVHSFTAREIINNCKRNKWTLQHEMCTYMSGKKKKTYKKKKKWLP